MIRLLLSLLLLVIAVPAQAWWNDAWTERRPFDINTTDTGAGLKQGLADAPVLVRLHAGNFDFATAREDGADLRFIAADDKTPLRFHIEKFDGLGQQALIWVRLPRVDAGQAQQRIWLYAGNEQAPAAGDPKGSYDVGQVLVYHFAEKEGLPQDATAFATHAGVFDGSRTAGAVIGAGLKLDGGAGLSVPAVPALRVSVSSGLTVSFWVKPELAGQNAELLDAGGAFNLQLENGVLKARAGSHEARALELAAGTWSHVGVSLGTSKLAVYVNGQPVAEAAAAANDMQVALNLGHTFKGEVDELQVANLERSADWLRFAAKSQGPEADKTLVVGEAESSEGGEEGASYFGVILQNVTLDGWVVIGILMVMMLISFMVMANKALVIVKMAKSNAQFLDAYRQLREGETAKLDSDEPTEDKDLQDSDLLMTLFGKHDHFQNSSLYRVYHIGVQELKHRYGRADYVNLSPQAIDAIRATLDGTVVRENQKLNALMVLLTIAISGGPFLGLLGTVVGVMITFAAIAATGDVNVAAIAPGIAAALVATVAGLAVAIPALFGYNYLGSRIKSLSADMHVFVDEFIAKIAETHA